MFCFRKFIFCLCVFFCVAIILSGCGQTVVRPVDTPEVLTDDNASPESTYTDVVESDDEDFSLVSGICGVDVIWQLDKAGNLSFIGNGEIDSFLNNESYRDNCTSVIISDGITSISAGAFLNCSELKNIKIPDSVAKIGNSAFFGCDNLTDIFYCGTDTQWSDIFIAGTNDALNNASIHFNVKDGIGNERS